MFNKKLLDKGAVEKEGSITGSMTKMQLISTPKEMTFIIHSGLHLQRVMTYSLIHEIKPHCAAPVCNMCFMSYKTDNSRTYGTLHHYWFPYLLLFHQSSVKLCSPHHHPQVFVNVKYNCELNSMSSDNSAERYCMKIITKTFHRLLSLTREHKKRTCTIIIGGNARMKNCGMEMS